MNQIKNQREITRARLIHHYRTYPKLQTEDIFKYIFQSAFGCEHLVSNEEAALRYIKKEYDALTEISAVRTEALDGEYTRVYLSCLSDGMTPETLTKIFCLSAKKEPDGRAALEEKLNIAKELIESGELPLDLVDFERKLAIWRAEGYPAVHHSEAFRAAYRPAYRVIANRYAERLDCLAAIDQTCEKDAMIASIKNDGDVLLKEILREVYE